jgi:hypothetical protein
MTSPCYAEWSQLSFDLAPAMTATRTVTSHLSTKKEGVAQHYQVGTHHLAIKERDNWLRNMGSCYYNKFYLTRACVSHKIFANIILGLDKTNNQGEGHETIF